MIEIDALVPCVGRLQNGGSNVAEHRRPALAIPTREKDRGNGENLNGSTDSLRRVKRCASSFSGLRPSQDGQYDKTYFGNQTNKMLLVCLSVRQTRFDKDLKPVPSCALGSMEMGMGPCLMTITKKTIPKAFQ
jgi:hypothetical protein